MPVAKGSTLDPDRTKAAVLAAATDIFYQRGLDGTGIARLCAEVGISKETLYRHFGSKTGLIEAVLRARSDRVLQWITGRAHAAGSDPTAQLAAVFDALTDWYSQPEFRGCAIINAATQQHAAPARDIAARHLNGYLELFSDIAIRAGAARPETSARQLLMLVEGATVVADHHADTTDAGDLAKHAAITLLHAAAKEETQ